MDILKIADQHLRKDPIRAHHAENKPRRDAVHAVRTLLRVSAEPTPKRGRGRPRATAEQVESRRQALIEAAYAEFAQRGYHDTGIADITARAGISHGGFYQHFAGKREILDDAFDWGVDHLLVAVLDTDTAPAQTPAELEAQFSAIARRVADVLKRQPGLARIMTVESVAVDAELTHRFFGLIETGVALITGFLDNGVKQGFLHPDLDTPDTARAVLGTILISILSVAAGTRQADDNDPYINATVRMIIRGITTTPNP
jgi:AcrR family transcriptional regulator